MDTINNLTSAQLYPETRQRLDEIAAALKQLGYTPNNRKITKIIDDACTLYLRKLERQLRRKDKQS